MTPLSPEFLSDPKQAVPGRPFGGLTLFWHDGKLVGRGLDMRGRVFEGPLPVDHAALAALILVVPLAAPYEWKEGGPSLASRIAAQVAVEAAVGAIRQKRWETTVFNERERLGFGGYLDRAFAAEREGCLPNQAGDLAYAAARVAGAWGGYACGATMILVAPPEKHEAVRNAATRPVGA